MFTLMCSINGANAESNFADSCLFFQGMSEMRTVATLKGVLRRAAS
jgi:hypothetical protein